MARQCSTKGDVDQPSFREFVCARNGPKAPRNEVGEMLHIEFERRDLPLRVGWAVGKKGQGTRHGTVVPSGCASCPARRVGAQSPASSAAVNRATVPEA